LVVRRAMQDRYQRTQVTITCGSNFRFQNNGGRHDVIASPYQIRSCNTSITNVNRRRGCWAAQDRGGANTPYMVGQVL
jgi:hypothetical protein